MSKSGANLGTGYILIVPKFDNLSGRVSKAMQGVDMAQHGSKMGAQWSATFSESGKHGLLKGGAMMGVFSDLTSKALGMVESSVGAAASRLDTLKRYPSVMQSLGYSAQDADSSLSKMDQHLRGLPTSLDSMVSTVQGIAAITGDLGQATDAALGLNDMLIASGANTQLTASAMEQFRQMLAKGKPDMQDWRSLTSAMPGQMAQLAKAMLGPTANANDLYNALGGGKHKATVSMGQLLDEITKLDKDGGKGIQSFASQAKTASGGLQTSMANMQTAVTRGVADVFDAIGTDRISAALSGFGSAMEQSMKLLAGGISAVVPLIEDVADQFGGLPGVVSIAVAAFAGFKGVPSLIGGVTPAVGKVRGALVSAKKDIGDFTEYMAMAGDKSIDARGRFQALGGALSTNLAQIGIGAAITGITMLVDWLMKMKQEADENTQIAEDLANVESHIGTAAGTASAGLGDLVPTSEQVRKKLDDLHDSMYSMTQDWEDSWTKLGGQRSELDSYIGVIEDLAGKSGLTATEQNKLKNAVAGYNKITGDSVSITDAQNGKLDTSTQKLKDNADQWYANARAQAYAAQVSDLFKQQASAQDALTDATARYNSAQERVRDLQEQAANGSIAASQALPSAVAELGNAQSAMQGAQGQLDSLNNSIGEYSNRASVANQKLLEYITNNGQLSAALQGCNLSAATFSDVLDQAGISQGQLAKMSQQDIANLIGAYTGLDQVKIGDKVFKVSDKGSAAVTKDQLNKVRDAVKGLPDNKTIYLSASATAVMATIKGVQNAFAKLGQSHSYSGGFMTHSATGGFMVAEHAEGGYIVTRPTAVGYSAGTLHIAGEDGAEWIEPHAGGIVPLTNTRYSRPFARTIARELASAGGLGGGTTNVYIDGAVVNADEEIESVFYRLLHELARYRALQMGRR